MATQYSNKPIVTNGLVYALDFGNPKSYVSGSRPIDSLKYDNFTGSILTYGGANIPNLENGLLKMVAPTATTGSTLYPNQTFSDLIPSGDFTLQLIVNNKSNVDMFMTQGPSGTRFISALSTTSTFFGWYINPLPYAQAGGSGGNYYSKSYPLQSRLQHLTYRYSSGSYDLFVNGVPVATSGRYAQTSTNTGDMTINGYGTLGIALATMDIGNLYIYSRPLTSDEIYSNYLIQAQRYGLSTTPKPYSIDENAYLFLSQSGITDPIITGSIDTFVRGLKANNLWDKMIAIYPFVGTGSAGINLTGSHSWNLKDPTTAYYKLTFTGSWNGSTSGSTPSGSNTAINTGVLPYEYYPFKSDSNQHISILSYDTPTTSSYLMGTEGTVNTSSFSIYYNSGSESGSITGSINNEPLYGIPSSGPLGLITVSRTGSNSLTIARNGVTSSFAVPASGALSTGIYLGAINNNGIAVGNSPVNISFASVGTGLTGAETSTYFNLLNTFKTKLRINSNVVTEDLILYLDAANINSYPGVGNTWRDLTLYANTASLFGGAAYNSTTGGNITFDGVSSYIVVPTSSLFDFCTATTDLPFSTSTWCFINNLSTSFVLFNKGDNGNGILESYSADINTAQKVGLTLYDGSGPQARSVTTTTSVPIGQWVNITTTYSGIGANLNLKIYINGVLQPVTLSNGGTYSNMRIQNTNLFLGSFGNTGTYKNVSSNGRYSVFSFYRKELSAQEVLQNFNATRGRYGV